ncbi:YggT family protein [Desulfonatronovibrio hydrogenovorans]|uniref:YggT family protein n=1 Tax=Desulfonatronovibrio hydrogenovorans TaxID=53245 RepID=UPI00048F8237|nr:YggT family protein [Desulfonatronovibrio hydrogenovorans]
MFVFSNFLTAIISVADTLLSLYFWIVIISALLSWVNPDPYNPIVRILRNLTEPVFYRVRTWIPFTNLGGIDLSPVVVLIGIQFIRMFIIQTLYQMAAGVG